MDTSPQNRSERINLRLKNSAKSLIERAAGFEGKTVSNFILTSALERAEQTIHAHEIITLNAKNSRTFFNALATQVKFNRKLTEALKEHSKRISSK